MTEEQIDELSKEAMADRLKQIYLQGGAVETYFMTEDILLETALKMDDFKKTIDFTSPDAKDHFTIISGYMKNSLMWTKNQNELREQIDEAILAAAKEKRLSAKSGTLEHRIKLRDKIE